MVTWWFLAPQVVKTPWNDIIKMFSGIPKNGGILKLIIRLLFLGGGFFPYIKPYILPYNLRFRYPKCLVMTWGCPLKWPLLNG